MRTPARPEIESLLAEAERRARETVCDELAGQLAQRYRDVIAADFRALGREVPPAPESHRTETARTEPQQVEPQQVESQQTEPGTRAAGPDDESGDAAWYLDAIVRAADLADGDVAELAGVEDRQVDLVRTDGLAAVVAEVPLVGFRTSGGEPDLSPDSWLHKAVRAHERVVERLCSRAAALPFRFGVLYPSRDQTRSVLHDNAEQLRTELDRLDGAAEWGVKARVTEPASSADEPPVDATGGTEWMLRRRAAAAVREQHRQLRVRIAAEIERALSSLARDCVVRSSSRPEEPVALTFDAVYLVSHGAEADFSEALRDVGVRYAEEGLRLEVTGPWPPYHFVKLFAEVPAGMGAAASGSTSTEPIVVPGGVHLPGPRTQHGAAP